MTKLSVEVPDDVAQRVAAAAAQRGAAPEALAGEVLAQSLPVQRRLGFIGIGRSGHDDTSERHEEIIAEAFAFKSSNEV